jgi:hypothetical protein
MERDGIMAHGLSYFLNESYMVRGDQYYMAICNKTGTIAVYNPEKNLFLSPFADGPLVFNKNVEGQQVLDAISKFGRSFSLLRIPFALKLLIQELQVMNIQMRIITEENIDQLTNLSFQSRNIDKLLQIDHGENGLIERDIKEIIDNYKKEMDKKIDVIEKDRRNAYKQYIPNETVEVQEFSEPNSNLEEGSPQYAETSPAYQPNSSELGSPTSSDYQPGSPQYPAVSPAYEPNSSEHEMRMDGGTINLFPQDPNMNASFNMLSGDAQAKLLQMEPIHRNVVMDQIMRQSAKTSLGGTSLGGTSVNNNDFMPIQKGGVLNEYFNKLPIDKQVGALKDGYKSMSTDFGKLSGKVPNPLVTFSKPTPMQDQLSIRLPLLSIEQKGAASSSSNSSDNSNSSESNSSDSNSSESNSTNNNSSSGGSTVKKITFG